MLVSLVIALGLALALGALAWRLRLPPLVGYLVAGIAVGPHTPWFHADEELTSALAEVGVALLLFGTGLHFRPADLLAVWKVAVPGAVAQVAIGCGLGALVGWAGYGFGPGPAAVFGLTLAIASTAVATRTLEDRGQLGGQAGRIALGWLVMQDLLMVLALVLVPAAVGASEDIGWALAVALLKLLAFAGVVLLLGRRLLPRVLARLARSRELFTLGVIVAALGVALAASELVGVSFALGAFFAGLVVGESDMGHQATADMVPLQRIFAALFFVSVGMLLDPAALLAAPFASVGALLAVLAGVGGAAFLLLLALRVPAGTAAAVAGALAQVGEFSFLLVRIAAEQGVLPEAASAPVLAAAFVAILAMPLTARGFAWLGERLEGSEAWQDWQSRCAGPPIELAEGETLEGHAILIGHGRVGRVIAEALRRHGLPLVVIEADRRAAERAKADGVPTIWGDAGRSEVMAAARPEAARLVALALPDAAENRRVLDLIRKANAGIPAAARAHDDAEMELLSGDGGVSLAVMGEREIALGMADFVLQRLGVEAGKAQATVDGMRSGLPG